MKRLIKNLYFWEIVFIFLLSLTPLLWYKTPDSLAVGHDLFFPLDPRANFLDRIHLWSTRYALGFNIVQDLGSLPIHALDIVVYSIGFSVQTTQKIIFIFWLLTTGLSAYYLSHVIGPKNTFFRLFATTFFMFNHFLLQGWFIGERTKFSIVIAAPLVLAFLIQAFEKRMRLPLALSLIGLTLFFFSGGSFPLYGGFILSIGVAFIYFFIRDRAFTSKKTIREYLIIFISLIAVFILVSLYWILPLISLLRTNYAINLGRIGGVSAVTSWVDVISKNASIQNLLRLQGFPDWNIGSFHPYAEFFLTNTLIIFVSFLFPLIAFTPIFWEKNEKSRRYILYFTILALVSIPFVAGTHPPFGGIFRVFVEFIPGFAVFRSSFFKFAPALWLSYSFLLAYGVYFFLSLIEKKGKYFAYFIGLASIVGVLLYNFPYFTGSFFNWNPPFSTMVNVPSYVYQFKDWVNNEKEIDGKILFLPSLNKDWAVEIYNWNYWSFSTVPSLFINKDIVINDHSLDPNSKDVINLLYSYLEDNNPDWQNINKYIGVKYVVLRKDFSTNLKDYPTTSFDSYTPVIKKYFTFIKSFGPWEIYKLKDKNYQEFYTAQNAINVYSLSGETNANEVLQWPGVNKYDAVFPGNKNIYGQNFSSVIKGECETCINALTVKLNLQRPLILPNSPLYIISKIREESKRKKNEKNPEEFIDYNVKHSVQKLAEIIALLDLNADPQVTEQSISSYNNSLLNIQKAFDEINSRKDKTKIISKAFSFLGKEHYELLRMLSNERYVTKNIFTEKITTTLDIFRKIYQKNFNDIIIDGSSSERRFVLNVMESGTYELFLEKKGVLALDTVDIVIDGQIIKRNAEEKENLLSLGSFPLREGERSAIVKLTQLKNITPFEEVTTDFQRGKLTCQNFPIKDFVSGQTYGISFNHKIEGADVVKPYVNIYQYDGNSNITSKQNLSFLSYSSSMAYGQEIKINNNTKKVNLEICPPSYSQNTDISLQLKDIKLTLFAFPNLIAIKEINNGLSKSTFNPKISVTKKDQTEYNIYITNASSPYFLILRQRYDSRWELFDKNNRLIPTHMEANMYANAWYLNEEGNYSLTVKIKGQDRQYVYYIVTLLIVLSLFGYVFFSITNKHNYENKN